MAVFVVDASVKPQDADSPAATAEPSSILDSLADAGGCLYVLEGATLGGRMITRHIQITPATGGRFFEGYGADTGTIWRDMRQMRAHVARDTQTEDAMVARAKATFACLRRWCESRHSALDRHA